MKRLLSAVGLGLALTCFSVAACTSTAGVPVEAQLTLASLSDGSATTVSGWSVALDEAVILVGPIYVYASEGSAMASLKSALTPVARAHGGFDPLAGRLVRAEYLEQFAFDALAATPVSLGPISGLLGPVDSASLVLDEPRGANASSDGATRGHHAWVRGRATREDVTVSFEGGLDLSDEGLTRRVDGIVVSGAPIDEGAEVRLGVDPSRWLAEADFASLVAGGGTITPETQPYRAWRLGLRSSLAYQVTVMEGTHR